MHRSASARQHAVVIHPPGERPHSASIDAVRGVQLRVEEFGEGEPIVFLHGLLGLNEHWRGVARGLTNRARCLLLEAPLLDLPPAGCTVEAVTWLVRRALPDLVDGPAVFVGNSMGGHLALHIALDDPERVRGLVLAGSSGLFERTIVEGSDAQHRPSKPWLEKKIAELFHDPARIPDGTQERVFEELSQRGAARALVRLSKSAKSDNLAHRLPEVKAPTLLLWGRQDTVTPPSVAAEFNSLIPNSRIHWLDDCGHAPQIEQAGPFALAVDSFLEELALAEAKRQEVA